VPKRALATRFRGRSRTRHGGKTRKSRVRNKMLELIIAITQNQGKKTQETRNGNFFNNVCKRDGRNTSRRSPPVGGSAQTRIGDLARPRHHCPDPKHHTSKVSGDSGRLATEKMGLRRQTLQQVYDVHSYTLPKPPQVISILVCGFCVQGLSVVQGAVPCHQH
jgi:hypothetical protein